MEDDFLELDGWDVGEDNTTLGLDDYWGGQKRDSTSVIVMLPKKMVSVQAGKQNFIRISFVIVG